MGVENFSLSLSLSLSRSSLDLKSKRTRVSLLEGFLLLLRLEVLAAVAGEAVEGLSIGVGAAVTAAVAVAPSSSHRRRRWTRAAHRSKSVSRLLPFANASRSVIYVVERKVGGNEGERLGGNGGRNETEKQGEHSTSKRRATDFLSSSPKP